MFKGIATSLLVLVAAVSFLSWAARAAPERNLATSATAGAATAPRPSSACLSAIAEARQFASAADRAIGTLWTTTRRGPHLIEAARNQSGAAVRASVARLKDQIERGRVHRVDFQIKADLFHRDASACEGQ
jgi:hypothetical protein